MGNKPVLAIVLILVIVACIAFMIHTSAKKSGGGASSNASQDRDAVCLACDKPFKVQMKDQDWMPMQMQGKNASKKLKCPACGKDEGVAAMKCASCGEMVANVGMMGMMGPGAKAPMCPKCKKPLMQSTPSGMPAGAGGPMPRGPGAPK